MICRKLPVEFGRDPYGMRDLVNEIKMTGKNIGLVSCADGVGTGLA